MTGPGRKFLQPGRKDRYTREMSALLLSLSDIALTFGGAPLLVKASLEVGPRARIALVGRNGSGKSTLLKIAAGSVTADSGERFLHPDAQVCYLPQEPEFGDHATAGSFVSAALSDANDLHLAERTLAEFGINADAPLQSVSGGEAKRIALAAAFVANPDVVLMDEPTNHLDIAAIADLESRIARSNAAFVIISHDRRFLETLTTQTVWIDRGETHYLSKGFSAFEEWRDARLEEEKAAHHKLGRKIAAEEDWVRYGVTARRKRNVRRMGELQTLRDTYRESRRSQSSVSFATTQAGAASKRMIVAEHISKSFGENTVVEDFSIKISRGDKIGVIAPNGAGKTTLLSMLTGALEPDAGTVMRADNMALVTLDQQRARLKPDDRLADAITDGRGDYVTVNGANKHVATYLQDFLFAPEQWRAPVSSLSGGERGRLALAAALAYPSNILALDEPTNDLDLETLDLLQGFLADYEGCVLLISHDRSFLDGVVASVISTDPNKPGCWIRYPGGYSDMLAQRGAEPGKAQAVPKAEKRTRNASAPKTGAQKLSYKEQFALKSLPDKIAALEEQINTLNEKLADPKFFEKDPKEFNACAGALEQARDELSEAEEQWLALTIKEESLSEGR